MTRKQRETREKLVIKLRDQHGWTFQKIAEELRRRNLVQAGFNPDRRRAQQIYKAAIFRLQEEKRKSK